MEILAYVAQEICHGDSMRAKIMGAYGSFILCIIFLHSPAESQTLGKTLPNLVGKKTGAYNIMCSMQVLTFQVPALYHSHWHINIPNKYTSFNVVFEDSVSLSLVSYNIWVLAHYKVALLCYMYQSKKKGLYITSLFLKKRRTTMDCPSKTSMHTQLCWWCTWHVTTHFHVGIQSLPDILFSQRNQNIVENSVLFFYCRVNSTSPTLRVTWTKNGIPLIQDVPHIRLRNSVSGVGTTTLLLVVDLFQVSDNGVYQCTATDGGSVAMGDPLMLNGKYSISPPVFWWNHHIKKGRASTGLALPDSCLHEQMHAYRRGKLHRGKGTNTGGGD